MIVRMGGTIVTPSDLSDPEPAVVFRPWRAADHGSPGLTHPSQCVPELEDRGVTDGEGKRNAYGIGVSGEELPQCGLAARSPPHRATDLANGTQPITAAAGKGRHGVSPPGRGGGGGV